MLAGGAEEEEPGQAGRTPSLSTDLSLPGSTEEKIGPVLSRVLQKGLEAPSRPEIYHSLHLGVRGGLSQRSTGKGLQQGHWPSGLLPRPPDTWLHSSHTCALASVPTASLPALLWLMAFCASPARPPGRRGAWAVQRRFLSPACTACLGGVCRSRTLSSYIQGGTSLVRSEGQLYQHNFLK